MIQVLMIIALLLTSMNPALAQLDKVLKGLAVPSEAGAV